MGSRYLWYIHATGVTMAVRRVPKNGQVTRDFRALEFKICTKRSRELGHHVYIERALPRDSSHIYMYL